jgi:23S rRNA (uridine2552-2'-O)-methyltransferase
MAKKRSDWMARHLRDPYVHQAQQAGYRSRAAFKLLEINERDRLIKPGMVVVDLGAAPGGWSQVATKLVGNHGKIIALDILPMDTLAGVDFIHGDFREPEVMEILKQKVGEKKIDLVISDMAPNISGIRDSDQARTMYLAELALDFARDGLRPGGDFLTKVFEGEGIDTFRKELSQVFSKVLTRKPKASRSESREIYLLGRGRIES